MRKKRLEAYDRRERVMHVGLVDQTSVTQCEVFEQELQLVHVVRVTLRVLYVNQVGVELLSSEREANRHDVRGVHAPELHTLVTCLVRVQREYRCFNYTVV